jgi:hypothetical protein
MAMHTCPRCGGAVRSDAPSCPHCGFVPGASPPAFGAGAGAAVGGTEGMAVASMVLGIAGFVACPLVCHVLAIVFGTQAKSRIRQSPGLQGDGMATAGIVLGWVGVGLALLFLVIIIIAGINSHSSSSSLGHLAQAVQTLV